MRDVISSAHQRAKHLHGIVGWCMQLHAKQWHRKCHRSDLFSTILLPHSKGRLTIENDDGSTCIFWMGRLQFYHRTMHAASNCSNLLKLPKNGTKRAPERLLVSACGLHATCMRHATTCKCPRRLVDDSQAPVVLEQVGNHACMKFRHPICSKMWEIKPKLVHVPW